MDLEVNLRDDLSDCSDGLDRSIYTGPKVLGVHLIPQSTQLVLGHWKNNSVAYQVGVEAFRVGKKLIKKMKGKGNFFFLS